MTEGAEHGVETEEAHQGEVDRVVERVLDWVPVPGVLVLMSLILLNVCSHQNLQIHRNIYILILFSQLLQSQNHLIMYPYLQYY